MTGGGGKGCATEKGLRGAAEGVCTTDAEGCCWGSVKGSMGGMQDERSDWRVGTSGVKGQRRRGRRRPKG
jgi:hypothetical protein